MKQDVVDIHLCIGGRHSRHGEACLPFLTVGQEHLQELAVGLPRAGGRTIASYPWMRSVGKPRRRRRVRHK